MANYALWWVGVAGVGMYGYATGRISDFIDNYKNKDRSINGNNNNNNNNNQNRNKNEERGRTIIVQSGGNNNNDNGHNSYLIPISCAFIFGLSGYYYYINSSGTKKVIGRVEKTAEETQNLVQETDENNAKRFEILDKKNETRAQNLELEIRSEQRAGFNVISEQLYCLQQVAIQTLSAVASLSSSSTTNNNNDNNNDENNEKLLGYCDKAQEMADTILSDQHILKTKQQNLKDIKAEIQLRNNDIININNNNNNNHQTPGGPPINDNNNNNNNNPFDINNLKNENTIITNVSSSSYNNNNDNNDDNNNNNDNNFISSIRSKIENGIKPISIGYHIWNNKQQYIVLATGTISVFYITKKVNDYVFNNNYNYKGNDTENYQIIQ